MNANSPSAHTNVPAATRADEIYNRIRIEILALDRKPGEQLEEDRLAEAYGVSRTPVREALRKLERDGLITIRPHRGAYIREISLREALEIDQLREILEPVAARQAAANITTEELNRIEKELDELETDNPVHEDFFNYLMLDVLLHDVILQAAQNETMRDVVTSLHQRMNSIRIISTAPRYRESIAEHKRIIAALRAGDGETAYAEMKEHIRRAREGRHRVFTERR